MTAETILRVAIPSALPESFDYLAPAGVSAAALSPGMRVAVRLGRQARVGVIAEVADETAVARERLKSVERVLDESPVVPAPLLGLLQWVARYYHQPLGGVLRTAMPLLARRGAPPQIPQTVFWECVAGGEPPSPRAVKQRALLDYLEDAGRLDEAALARRFPDWRPVMRRLLHRGLVARHEESAMPAPAPRAPGHRLNREQQAAVDAVAAGFGEFHRHLLEGVTGSGKTEVYLALCEQALERGEQALVLVPEIALTAQTVERFRAQLPGTVCVFHSGLTDRERFHCWSAALSGDAGVVIGTRSAVFLPFKRLGLAVVDEEHDASYKQSESSFRYHARDVAIKRAQTGSLPVVLGSATPSLESLHNALEGRYARRHLTRRAAGAAPPRWRVIDLRGSRLEDGLSPPLLAAMRDRLAAREQVLLFLNRRGYAPVMLCRDCGGALSCARCDARLVYHLRDGRLHCHHCGVSSRPPGACSGCGGDMRLVGLGTEKVEPHLTRLFPETGIVRIDTDAVRRKNEVGRGLERVRSGDAGIALGTRRLTKGHAFPAMTLVGIVNADQSLFAADFRAIERLGQLIVQVGGRAGRGAAAGEVMLQTHHPHHPQLQVLLKSGYGAFALQLLPQREAAQLPPYRHLAVIRARSAGSGEAAAFLDLVHRSSEEFARRHATQVFPPAPMMMEKKAGHYRAQLLLSAAAAHSLNACLAALLPVAARLARRRKVRWHVDVDPCEAV